MGRTPPTGQGVGLSQGEAPSYFQCKECSMNANLKLPFSMVWGITAPSAQPPTGQPLLGLTWCSHQLFFLTSRVVSSLPSEDVFSPASTELKCSPAGPWLCLQYGSLWRWLAFSTALSSIQSQRSKSKRFWVSKPERVLISLGPNSLICRLKIRKLEKQTKHVL